MASAGSQAPGRAAAPAAATVRDKGREAAQRLDGWLVAHDYRGYDPFDGLNARLLRPLTLGNPYLRIALQQGIRRFPWNLRPLVGIPPAHSSKGMGFLARGYLRLHAATGEQRYLGQAVHCLDWLLANRCPGYSGACWGNHFDYQSRVFYLPKGVPTVVWVALIGHAFLEAFDRTGDRRYLDTAVSACEHIRGDLATWPDGDDLCISYIPTANKQVHNANTLAASLLARVHALTGCEAYRTLAARAIGYTVKHQRPDGSWWYGEAANLHWVDNFHTAYVLDSLKHYGDGAGDSTHRASLERGYAYWKRTFFLADGTPRYYAQKTMPLDIQCAAQAIDTLVFFRDHDPAAVDLAARVAAWTIDHLQDPSGYFWFRRYGHGVIDRTPTLHWGQATMLCALGGLSAALADGQTP